MTSNVSRRTLVKAGVGLSLARPCLGLALDAPVAERRPVEESIAAAVRSGHLGIGAAQRPHFRYWWPGGDVLPGDIREEVGAMADAGFGGFEICDVRNSEHVVLTDPAFHFGSQRWRDGVVAAFETARARGLEADLYIGPGWPAVAEGIDPDSDAAMKELTYGLATITAGSTHSGVLPQPHAAPSGLHSPYAPPGTGLGIPQVAVAHRLEALHVARILSRAPGAPLVIERKSLTDITASVVGNAVHWQAPAQGDWALIASWSRGTAMIPAQLTFEGYFYPLTARPAYVVDHFGAAGAQAVIGWWERDLLTPALRALLRAAGGSFFEDSLEFVTECHWTPRMLAEFETRRGYPLKPCLPLVQGGEKPVFVFEDQAASDAIRRDYARTLSDLFIANHLAPLEDWARIYGMAFRHQSYCAPIDAGLAAAQPGVPEGESLEFGADVDRFRVLAAGRDLGHQTKILSSELGAERDQAYKQTLASLVALANIGYGAGVNQVRIHGFPHGSSPTGQWPGFLPFAPMNAPINFSEAWGPRQPQWAFVDDLSGYMARVQAVLQAGVNKVDLAIYRDDVDLVGGFADTAALTREGYLHQPVDAGLLSLPSATVRDGVLDRDGPAYRALLVINQPAMRADRAKQLLALARAGLPVIVVGAVPALASPGQQPKTFHKARLEEAAPLLQSLGIGGSARTGGAAALHVVRRVAGADSFYFIHNASTRDVADTITLLGAGAPWRLDPWSGQVTALTCYDTRQPGHLRVPIALRAGEAVILILSTDTKFAFQRGGGHVLAADCDVVPGGQGLAARASASGMFTATLENRARLRASANVPEGVTIEAWQLVVEDWQAARPQGVEGEAVATRKLVHAMSLDRLAPWQDLPGLADVSGIGTYTATVTLPDSWRAVSGARLMIGEVGAGSVRVRVNGETFKGIDQSAPVVDLAGRLRTGANVIEIVLATTLINRLRQSRPKVFGQPGQSYGLRGPVRLQPYVDVPLT